jgi:hypothetical protein
MLFDTEVDPNELHNIWLENREMVKEFVAVYRDRLAPLYERYCEATTDEQPSAPFAVGARHLNTSPEARRVSFPLDRRYYKDLANSEGWILSTHWSKFWLLAKETDQPIRVEVAIPNGSYRVTAHIAGSATFEVPPGVQLTVSGEPFEPAWDIGCQEVSIGEVTIEDKAFLATIIPHAEQNCFFLKYLGFSPMSRGRRNAEFSDIELDRLRALGYLD